MIHVIYTTLRFGGLLTDTHITVKDCPFKEYMLLLMEILNIVPVLAGDGNPLYRIPKDETMTDLVKRLFTAHDHEDFLEILGVMNSAEGYVKMKGVSA